MIWMALLPLLKTPTLALTLALLPQCCAALSFAVSSTGSDALDGLVVAALAVALLVCFVGIALVCDDHLVPIIEHYVEVLKIPDQVAGATLLAFASSAPEIFISCVATFESKESFSFTAMLGSAMIAFGVITSLCGLYSKGMELDSRLLIRESVFYIIGLAIFFYAIYDEEIRLWESSLLVLWYFVYVAFVWCFDIDATSNRPFNAEEARPLKSIEPPLQIHTPLQAEPVGKDSNLSMLVQAVSFPFQFFFNLTIPQVSSDQSVLVAGIALVMACAWIGVLSEVCLLLCDEVASKLSLADTTAGVTILALGAQIPDTLASLAMARVGFAHAAIASATGSQVINVSFGIGVPAFLYSLSYGTPFVVSGGTSADVYVLCLITLGIIALFLLMTLPVKQWVCCVFDSYKASLTTVGSWILISAYFASVIAFVVYNEVW